MADQSGTRLTYWCCPEDDTEHCELSCRIEPVAKPARLWLEITDLTEARTA